MNKTLYSLWVNIIFFILSTAEPLKLIPGDHKVIKKDGVTHSISKYYVVPADFSLNVTSNASEVSRKAIGSTNKKNIKVKNNAKYEEDDARNDTMTTIDKLDVYSVDMNDNDTSNAVNIETEVLTENLLKTNENNTEPFVTNRFDLDSEALGNLQVEPINHIISSNVTSDVIDVNNEDGASPVEHPDETYTPVNTTSNADNLSDDFLKDYVILISDSIAHNVDGFWGIFYSYVNNISDQNERLNRMEKLYILLNVFTNLYEKIQRNIPIDGTIDDLTNTILKSHLINNHSDRKHHSNSKYFTENHINECLRKCYHEPSRLNLDSKDVSISETGGWVGYNNKELENRHLETQIPRDSYTDNVDVWLKMPKSNPESIPQSSTDQLINIAKSELVNPNNLETQKTVVVKPDKYNILSPKQTLREGDIYDNGNLKLTILDTVEKDKLPWSVRNHGHYYMQKTVKSPAVDNLLWSVDDNGGKHEPLDIENEELIFFPWSIDDRTIHYIPRVAEDKLVNEYPWKIEEKLKHNLLLNSENKVGSIPIPSYPNNGSELTASSHKFVLGGHQNPFLKGVVATNHIDKPYVYSYAVKPEKFLYQPKITKKIVKITSGKYPNNNLESYLKKIYESSTYGKNLDSKIMLINNNFPQYYEYNKKPGFYVSPLKIDKDNDFPLLNNKAFIESELITPLIPQSHYGSDLKLNLKHGYYEAPLENNKDNDFPVQDEEVFVDTESITPQTLQGQYESDFKLYERPGYYEFPLKNYDGNVFPIPDKEAFIESEVITPQIPQDHYETDLKINLKPGYYESLLKNDKDNDFPVQHTETFIEPEASQTPRGHYESDLKLYLNPDFYESSLKTYKNNDFTTPDDGPFIEPEDITLQSPIDHYESDLTLSLNEERDNNPTVLYPNVFSDSSIKLNHVEEHVTDEPIVERNSEILNEFSNFYGPTLENLYSNVQIPTDQTQIDVVNSLSSDLIAKYKSQSYIGADGDLFQPEVQSILDSKSNVKLGRYIDTTSDFYPNNKLTLEPENLETKYGLLIRDFNGETAYSNVAIPDSSYGNAKPSISRYDFDSSYGNNDIEKIKSSSIPTYQLFSIENLIKLHKALFNIQHRSKLNAYQVQALANLKKINNILLTLAQNSGEAYGNQGWYEDKFYDARNGTPLQVYVYNLLRQKWLHDIMLALYSNNFDSRFLSNPRLFSVLKGWRFPNYVLKLLEIENIDAKLAEENDHVADNIVDDIYKTHTNGLVLSITEIKAELDADAIINILKHYLFSKKYLEEQENIINRGNKAEMLKQIVLFLKGKGYQGRTILDLIRRLYGAVFSVEGKDCTNRQNNFVQAAYNVIVPVLRRSAQ